jgi:DNA-binding MarR family transcriptional regulator
MLTVMSHSVEDLIWETRRLFQTLTIVADEALKPLRIKGSDRALIEFLVREPHPISLAALARKRSVSRQHIHQSLGRLRNPRWIEQTLDPRDARSILLRLTDEGRSLWKQIRAIDRVVLRKIARDVEPSAVQAATQTLRKIRMQLQRKNDDD